MLSAVEAADCTNQEQPSAIDQDYLTFYQGSLFGVLMWTDQIQWLMSESRYNFSSIIKLVKIYLVLFGIM